jgi:predicted nuclease of predicted toxin-antitoxin system
MRFLTDQDVYRMTVEQIREWGHDVVTAKEFGMQRAGDKDLVRKAIETNRLFITRDKDFGTLVFLEDVLSAGVILLRCIPTTVKEVHKELYRLFQEHTEDELKNLFCVVEPHRHRIRYLQ